MNIRTASDLFMRKEKGVIHYLDFFGLHTLLPDHLSANTDNDINQVSNVLTNPIEENALKLFE